jgi:GNAT superfamily N-acetyltransferase
MSTAFVSSTIQDNVGSYLPMPPSIVRDGVRAVTLPTRPTDTYFADSDIYQIRNEFMAEVIYRPGSKAADPDLMEKMKEELGDVLLQAFGKTRTDAHIFLAGEKFTKVAINVDYLVVVRRNGKPVAYGAGNYIAPYIFYFNSLMVLPRYQRVGVGFYISGLLWKYAIQEARERRYIEPDIVCRTHNRNIASAVIKLMRTCQISTEKDANKYSRMIFQKTADFLHCEIDPATGISKNVYPAGLPEGTKTADDRVNLAFSQVGPQDGIYIAGKLDQDYINGILAASVREVMVQEPLEEDGILAEFQRVFEAA